MTQVIRIMDDLAADLGVTFKESKDEGTRSPESKLDFLGITIDVSGSTPTAAPPPAKL